MIYNLLRFIVRIHLRYFFKHVHISGRENIPKNTPIVVSSNHPNAYVEAMLIGGLLPLRLSILARADVFKKKWIRVILTKFHLIPVYRPRDGKSNMYKNKESFSRAIIEMKGGDSILIFSEGTSQMGKHLFPFKTGTARLSIQGVEETGEEVVVLPISISYTHFTRQQKSVYLHISEPIKASAFFNPKLHEKERNDLVVEMTKQIEQSVKENIVQVEKEKISLYNTKTKAFRDSLVNNKKPWIRHSKKALQTEITYSKTSIENELKPLEKRKINFPFVLEMPFIILGFLFHYILMGSSEVISALIPLDKEFYSSVWLSVSMVLALFFAILLCWTFGGSTGLVLSIFVPLCLLSFYRNTSENFPLSPFKNKI